VWRRGSPSSSTVSRFIPISCTDDSKIQRKGSNRWKDGPSKASQRLFASLIVIAASGIKRALIIERSRARSGQRLSESGALEVARGDDPYFFLFFA
jgi:hypothetical protein